MTEQPDKDITTVPAGDQDDVVSDPALAAEEGADWSSEGGATLEGPATDTDDE